LKKFGFDFLLQESRIVINFQFSKHPVLCHFDEIKDIIHIDKMKSNYFWERSILHSFGERSWHFFLKREARKEWDTFVHDSDYASVFEYSSGQDSVIESWADTFTRYIINDDLPEPVETKFKEITGIRS